MAIGDRDELLQYYERELTYLRRMGAVFAEQYPKVAGRLELGTDYCPDPNVERMIEAFAFLTARIQHNIDSQFPEISSAILGVLYPHFLDPIPSMSIAQFEPDPEQVKLTTGHTINKNTPLFTQTHQGDMCRFRTSYPVTLWPVKVAHAGYESTDQYDFLDTSPNVATVLRLKLQSTGGSFDEMGLKRLRFYINGEGSVPFVLYEQLFSHVLDVVVLSDKKSSRPAYLPRNSIQPVGFAPDEDVLPCHPFAHPAYRLLQEYFSFHDKFLFFDIDHLDAHGSKKTLDILILLDEKPKRQMVVDSDTFRLGCTPVINLFRKTTEPIRWDHRQTEYLLMADARRERSTEIHSILKISGTSDAASDVHVYEPFYSFNHQMNRSDHQAFWYARRTLLEKKNLPGTEMYLSFLDLKFRPAMPAAESIYAHTLCTNRDLAEQIPGGGLLQIEEAAPVLKIYCLKKPTRQVAPAMGGEAQWRLISHLSLNFLSLAGGRDSLKAFREILGLYSFSDRLSIAQQINGIREMQCRKVVRRIGVDAWRGFSRGIEVTLSFDESLYAGSSAFLLASVLNHFLPLYASVNTFTQLIIKSQQREGIWKKWPPMVGEQIVL